MAMPDKLMKNKYFDEITKILKQTRPKLALTYQLEFKSCFGAIAGYVNGRIFISCGKFGTALRFPQETLAILFKEKGVKHLKYFPNGHIKKEYAILPKRIIKNKQRIKGLVDNSITYVLLSP